MLRAMARNAHRVAFLERVRANQMRRHLPRDTDERNGIQQRVSQTGDGIGRAGA